MHSRRETPLITLKQAEAFYWIAKLGSVVDAAERLHLAPSTLSKRLLELEAVVGVGLFSRGNRTVSLTRIGEDLLPIAADLLAVEARFREAVAGPRAFRGPFRFGVTELVALTWLPKLVLAIRREYPEVAPEPEVDSSVFLFEKLADRRLDFVIGLDPPSNVTFRAVPLDNVALRWICAPGFGPEGDAVPLSEVAKYPILTQGEGSGLHKLLFDWFHASGVGFNRIVKCNSLDVLTTLAAAGLGITFVAEPCARAELGDGRLRTFRTLPALPPVQYFAVSRLDTPDAFTERVARIVQACCEFTPSSA